jgi:transcription initiation factor TFIIIB Brf1 subunit/transcription initiation factor TFIIB
MTLVSQHNIYINCRRTNGTTMLKKSADHESISGKQVGPASRMIITSRKLEIWPLEALENKELRKL